MSTHQEQNPSACQKFKGFTVPRSLSWQNPVRTGTLLAFSLLGYLIVASHKALASLAWLAAAVLFSVSLLETVTRRLRNSDSGIIRDLQLSKFFPQHLSECAAKGFNRGAETLCSFLDVRSPCVNFRVAAGLWVLSKLLSWFSLSCLLLVVLVFTFSAPALYLQFKPQADDLIRQGISVVHQNMKTVHEKAHEKAGPQMDFVRKFLGPCCGCGGCPKGRSDTSDGAAQSSNVCPATSKSSGADTTSVPLKSNASAGVVEDVTFTGARNPTSSATSAKSSVNPFTHPESGKDATNPETAPFKVRPDDVAYDSVPTMVGNIPLDKETLSKYSLDAAELRDSLNKDKDAF